MSLELARGIREAIINHHKWRSKCVNLIAAENVTSPLVRETLASDFGHRYAIGFLRSRIYRGCRYIDEVEALTTELAKKVFRAEYVNYISISGTMANLVVFNSLTSPGDVTVALSVLDGGHSSFRECTKIHGVSLVPLAFDANEMNIDVDRSIRIIMRVKPKLIMLGASEFLFPHPVKELSEAASEVNTIVTYDAAHVLGLIAGNYFQDPLREGAEIITGSTHKTFFGPQGGIIISVSKYADLIDHAVWQLVNNHHIHRVAGLAITLCEFLAFGKEYAEQVIKNARKLAESLYDFGINVLCPHKGFTKSHQVLFKAPKGNGEEASRKLEEANIITNKVPLPWDSSEEVCSGIRIGTQEVTRLGMKEGEMEDIAELIKKIIIDKEDPAKIRRKVEDLVKDYQEVKYCFTSDKAYKYFPFCTELS